MRRIASYWKEDKKTQKPNQNNENKHFINGEEFSSMSACALIL